MQTRKNYGWVRDLLDHRDIYLEWPEIKKVPDTMDLRENTFLPKVYNQLNLGSCTANAIATAYSYDQNIQLLPEFEPSRLFIYYNERKIEHKVNYDSGASIRDGIKVINKIGVCEESLYPYDIDKFKRTPAFDAYENAKKHRSVDYRRIDININEAMKAVAINLPVVFGFSVYESFETIGSDGIMPMPKEDERIIGGHAVVIIGYTKTHLIIRNSWGDDWGDKGDFYMPFSFFNSAYCADAWIINTVVD